MSTYNLTTPPISSFDWYAHNFVLHSSQGFSIDETKRLMQIIYYFHNALQRLLSSFILRENDYTFMSDQARDEFIDRFEEAHTLDEIRSIDRSFQHKSRIRITITGNETSSEWRLLVMIAPGNGDALLDQVQDLMSIAETAIGWRGGGSQGLRKWPPNVLGLGRFLLNRGKGSVTEQSLPDQRLRVRTPFPAAMGFPKGRSIDVSRPFHKFVINEAGTLVPLLPGEENLGEPIS